MNDLKIGDTYYTRTERPVILLDDKFYAKGFKVKVVSTGQVRYIKTLYGETVRSGRTLT